MTFMHDEICMFCDESFPTKSELKKHEDRDHDKENDELRVFRCMVCGGGMTLGQGVVMLNSCTLSFPDGEHHFGPEDDEFRDEADPDLLTDTYIQVPMTIHPFCLLNWVEGIRAGIKGKVRAKDRMEGRGEG